MLRFFIILLALMSVYDFKLAFGIDIDDFGLCTPVYRLFENAGPLLANSNIEVCGFI